MEEGLLKNTGQSLNHWIEVVKKSGLDKHSAIVNHLKTDYGFTHGYANFVSLKAREADAGSIDDNTLLESQYKGKENLKPIYNKLVAEISKFGNDITQTPKKDSVSMIRKKQFALIKPATKTRVDLGLKLKDKPTTDRLGNSGPFGAMCTHRVQITDASEVDSELIAWLKEAYEKAE